MAKRREGVGDRLLETAKEEFLEKGFDNVSLREVAEKADASTNAIYVRFHDKAGLFSAIVQDTAAGFIEMVKDIHFSYLNKCDNEMNADIYYKDDYKKLMQYVYDNIGEFRLLTDISHGSEFNDFIEQLAKVEESYLIDYCNKFVKDGVPKNMNQSCIQSYSRGAIEAFFEPVRCGVAVNEAVRSAKYLQIFTNSGIKAVIKAAAEK